MKVSILSPNLSSNNLGRSYLLAQLLERNYDVEIIGPVLGDGIWDPLAGEYDYKSITMNDLAHEFPLKYSKFSNKVTGDIIYAMKPITTSFGWGLLYSKINDKPLVLDIDDWESGFFYNQNNSRLLTHIKHAPLMIKLSALNYRHMLEYLYTIADQITVSNEFLKKRFGGTIIPHVRDTDVFDPAQYNKQAARSELDIPSDKFIVLFSGTPRPHKGLEDLIDAVNKVENPDIYVIIMGTHKSEYVDSLKSRAGDKIIFRGRQPFTTLPKWIAASDTYVIPQRDSYSTRGQLPAKLFDAMAMGKPIVATSVSDIPNILDGCGTVVSPNSPDELGAAIQELYRNPVLRDSHGQQARKKCIEKYSYDSVAPRLVKLIDSIVS